METDAMETQHREAADRARACAEAPPLARAVGLPSVQRPAPGGAARRVPAPMTPEHGGRRDQRIARSGGDSALPAQERGHVERRIELEALLIR